MDGWVYVDEVELRLRSGLLVFRLNSAEEGLFFYDGSMEDRHILSLIKECEE